MIDVNNANDEGPFSPQRTGGLPSTQLAKFSVSKGLTYDELKRKLTGQGGLYSYFETDNVPEIIEKSKSGDLIIAAFKNHRFAGYGRLISDFYRDGPSLDVRTNDGRVFGFKERFDCEWTVISPDKDPNFVDCSDLRSSLMQLDNLILDGPIIIRPPHRSG